MARRRAKVVVSPFDLSTASNAHSRFRRFAYGRSMETNGHSPVELLPQEIVRIVGSFLNIRTLCVCLCVSKGFCEVFADEAVFADEFERLNTMACHPPPIFPGAGTWRMVCVRALRKQVLVHVVLVGDVTVSLVLPRSESLFALKRATRCRQMEALGVELEDFELRNVDTSLSLRVKGNDNLPPINLRTALMGQHGLLRNGLGAQTRRTLRRAVANAARAWRTTMEDLRDGTVLEQVIEVPMTESVGKRDLRQLVDTACGTAVGRGLMEEALDDLLELLGRSHETRYKLLGWDRRFHPLVYVIFSRHGLGLKPRIRASVALLRALAMGMGRRRFLHDVLARAALGSGFPVLFTRLWQLVPVLARSQLVQLVTGEVDIIPVFTILELLVRITSIVFRAAGPMVVLSLVFESLRTWKRVLFRWDSGREEAPVFCVMLVILEDILLLRRRWWMLGGVPRISVNGTEPEIVSTPPDDLLHPWDFLRQQRSWASCFKFFFVHWLATGKPFPTLPLLKAASTGSGLGRGAVVCLGLLLLELRRRSAAQFALGSLAMHCLGSRLGPSNAAFAPVWGYTAQILVALTFLRVRLSLNSSFAYYLLF